MVALGAWTAFLWVTRIKNAVGDSEMSTGGQVIAVATSVAFLVAAGVVTAQVWRRAPRAGRLAVTFAAVSIGYWVIRALTIVVRDHPLGFTVVHVALALVTVGLAALVLRAVLGRGAGSSPAPTAG